MEQEVYEKSIFDEEQIPPVYAGFWERFGALFLDGLILLPLSLISRYNQTTWRSVVVLVTISLISLTYKPLLEYLYGATPGKKALSIAVTNTSYNKPNLKEAILRNIFSIAIGLFSLFTTASLYDGNQVQQVTTTTDFSNLDGMLGYTLALGGFVLLLYLTEIIVLLVDKENRSLHDFIAGTYVIKKYR